LITLLKRMLLLVLLLIPSLSLSTLLSHGATSGHPHPTHTPTSASPTSSFKGIKDPSTQCIDISCYKPIVWSEVKEDVCRFRKEKIVTEKCEQVCTEVPEYKCELVDYTKCDWDKTLVPVRDDKVVGEKFVEKECYNFTITVDEIKPKCINVTKPSCEERWIPEPPYWEIDPSTCVNLTWLDCNKETYLQPVPIDDCDCKDNEIWYNKLERVETQCVEEVTTCVPKLVPVCETVLVEECKRVCWPEITETCKNDCSKMHFRTPSQEPDHRRWCSHVEIIVPTGVNVPTKGNRELTDQQSTIEVTNSNSNIMSTSNDNIVSNSNDNIVSNDNDNVVSNDNDVSNDDVVFNSNDNVVSNPRSKKRNSFSNAKAETTYSNQRSNFQRTTNPDGLGSPLVYSRSASSSNRRSSVSQIIKGKRTIRQGQQIRG